MCDQNRDRFPMDWLTGSADLGRQSTLSVQVENTRWKNHPNRKAKAKVEQNEISYSAARDKWPRCQQPKSSQQVAFCKKPGFKCVWYVGYWQTEKASSQIELASWPAELSWAELSSWGQKLPNKGCKGNKAPRFCSGIFLKVPTWKLLP